VHIIDLREFEEEFVIHFGGKPTRINAYTLASTLVSIADAAKAANAVINPGYEVEIVVEALGSGSFKAKVRSIYKGLGNLFDKGDLKAVALSVIAAFIYQHTLAPDTEVNVIVNEDEVIIEQGETKVLVPREVHDCVNEVEKSEPFKRNIDKAFESVEKDESIESLGITPRMEDETPAINVPREKFPLVTGIMETEENSRVVYEIAELSISRAILERTRRKWEFVWRGVKIAAPVLDHRFYDDFFAHRVTIAPGDSLDVKLKIYQVRDTDTGIFMNKKYEVVEVRHHLPRLRQTTIEI
jgi:hypothetical protein